MADVDNKFPANVPGAFYVDSECIDCDLCRETAPTCFSQHEDGYSFVSKQPEGEEETEQMHEAIDSCPVEAIGDDGA